MMAHLRKLRPLYLPLLIAAAGTVVMAWFLLQSLLHGDLTVEGRRLIDMPWGLMSLIDIYTGLILYSCWIGWRERQIRTALLWIVSLFLLGNLSSCIYMLVAIWRSGGSLDTFIYGNRQGHDCARQPDQPGHKPGN